MIVTTDFLAGLTTAFQAIFKTAFDAADKDAEYKMLCLLTESTSDKENYNWLEAVPALSEWKDARKIYGLGARDYEVKNVNYEATIGIDRNTLEDEKYQMIQHRVRQLASRAVAHMNNETFKLLNLGVSTKTFDAKNFFVASGRAFGHSGSIVNIAAGAYGASEAEIRSGIAAAIILMRNYKDDRGEPLNLVPDTLVCSPTMEIIVRQALLPGVAGTVRPEAQIISRIIVSPHLTSGATAGHDYYLICTKSELKAMVSQIRKKPVITALDKPEDTNVFMKRHIYYGVDYRGAVAFLEPRCAVMIDTSD